MKKAYPDESHPKAEEDKDVLNHFWKYCFLAVSDEGAKVIAGARCLMAWNESCPIPLQTCVGADCPKDTRGAGINSVKITEPCTLEEICGQTPGQSRSS